MAEGDALHSLLEALRRADCDPVQSGRGWDAFCPAHQAPADRSRSRKLHLEQGTKVEGAVFRCLSGCDYLAVLEALAWTKEDLLDEPPEAARERVVARRDKVGQVEGRWERKQPEPPEAIPQLCLPVRYELESIARHRGVFVEPLEVMADRGVLYTSRYRGCHAWITGDLARRSWRIRRMDGRKWWDKEKSITFKGHFGQNWPIGLQIAGGIAGFRSVELVEGEGDLVAAYHASIVWEWADGKSLPCAMAGAGITNIDAGALEILAAMPDGVRIWPHKDRSGAGAAAAERWAGQIARAGGRVRIGQIPEGCGDLGDYVRPKTRGQ
jgi:hypothetical protein